MNRTRLSSSLVAAGAAGLAACSGGGDVLDPAVVCHVGICETEDGEFIDIGALGETTLRWRTMDGRTGRISNQGDGSWSGQIGWTDEPHSAEITFGDCGADRITVAGVEGVHGEAQRLALDVVDTAFEGEGETLAGRLVTPPGDGPLPLVVLVHGSERYSARDYYAFQRILSARGIAVFVYDKRGSGGSTGEYTQDFDLLPADAAAALAEARRLGGDRISAAGYHGGSQGGWIAPYAASMSDADFVIAAFGMAQGPLAENRDETLLGLVEAGYGENDEAMAGGLALAEAAGLVMMSGFDEGVAELAALKRQYKNEDWYEFVRGEFTHEFLGRPIWMTRMGMPFFDVGTSWEYEPRPVLEALDMPSLWVLAADDREAPPAATRAIIEELQAQGHPYDLAVFPDADHGIIEYRVLSDGSRASTRYSEGYFDLIVSWAQTQQLDREYGRSETSRRISADTPE